MRDPSTIAVLLFDRMPMFETAVPISVFGVDRSSSRGVPAFELLAVAAEPGPLTSTAGLRLQAPHGLDALERASVIIVPSWRDPHEEPRPLVLDAIRDAHASSATIVSLCMGAFVLAAAGLLDGRRATTHWLHAGTLAARYPRVRVDPTVLYVDEGDLVTSAGTAAGLDACLHLVRRTWGAHAASAIARRMVVPPHRSGGQAQYIEQPIAQTEDSDGLGAAMAHALGHLDQPLDIDMLAAIAQHSRRTFDRRFRALTGISPLRWLLHQRVLRAQRLLEDTDLSIDTIATQIGFSSAVSLRPHFRRLVGTSPQSYRDTYRGASMPHASTTVEPEGSHREPTTTSKPVPYQLAPSS